MVAIEYFLVHFATDKLDIATPMLPWRKSLQPSETLMRLEIDLDFQ